MFRLLMAFFVAFFWVGLIVTYVPFMCFLHVITNGWVSLAKADGLIDRAELALDQLEEETKKMKAP